MPASAPRRRGRGKRLVSDINVVPYIDVMLVLLVIFMVTAPFVPTSTIDLPAVDATPRQPEPYIEVQVAADGKLAADGKGSQPVVISGDKQVRYETILDVMGDIKQQGVARVGLMVKPRPTAPARSS